MSESLEQHPFSISIKLDGVLHVRPDESEREFTRVASIINDMIEHWEAHMFGHCDITQHISIGDSLTHTISRPQLYESP